MLPTQDREEVDWIGIEGMGMHGWGETNTGLKGPDIGWMPLSAKEAASIESLGGVFHNRRRTMEDFSGEVCQISVAFGFVDAASSPSDKKIVAHPMFIGRRRRGRIPLYPTISRHISDPFFCSRAPGWRGLAELRLGRTCWYRAYPRPYPCSSGTILALELLKCLGQEMLDRSRPGCAS